MLTGQWGLGLSARATRGPFLAASFLILLAHHTGAWEFQCVDSPRHFSEMSDRSSCLDSLGHPHVAYGEGGLYYAWFDGTSWCHEIADTSSGVGKGTAIALGATGIPHISYLTSDGKLKYASKDSSGWFAETALDSLWLSATSIAVDSAGDPHLAAVTEYFCGFLYAFHVFKTETGWQAEAADLGFDTMHEPTSISLQIDMDGRLCLAHWLGQGMRFAYRDASGWHAETAVGGMGFEASLAVEPGGIPHIAFTDGAQRLKHAFDEGSGWQVETVSGTESVWQPSIGLDNSGQPCVSYHRDFYPDQTGYLKFARREASGWELEVVDSGGSVGSFSSLVVGQSGVIISYFDDTNSALKMAKEVSTGWQLDVIDKTGPTGYNPSLALENGTTPRIAYGDFAIRSIRFAVISDGTWLRQTIESTGITVLSPSLALGSMGEPHVCYWGGQIGHLMHAWLEAGSWSHTIVDIYGGVASLAMDFGDHPHVTYDGMGTLRYAFEDHLGWHIDIVDGDYVNESSLALDSFEHPHVAYRACTAHDLRYAYGDATGWHMEMVDGAGDTGYHVSLALGLDDSPHLAYFDLTGSDLRYAFKAEGCWTIELVDTLGRVGYYSDLDLDSNQQPHIAYLDLDNGDLKYAVKMLDGWHLYVVDAAGRTGGMPSLELDDAGAAHIAYHDSTAGSLMYAHHAWPPMIAMTGSMVGAEFQLQWSTVRQADGYWMYGAANNAYFGPGIAPGFQFRLAVLPAGVTSWLTPYAVGDPEENWTYLVMAVDGAESELCRSNRVGEFDFDTSHLVR